MVHKRYLKAQVCIAIANCPPQHSPDYIACLYIRRGLPICNGKSYCTEVVHYHPNSRVNCSLSSVHLARCSSSSLYKRHKKICVVTRVFGLKHHDQPLQSHARIHMFGRQMLKSARSQAVVLHKYQIPQFNHLRMALIHKCLTRHLLPRCLWSNIYMNLCTRTTRTGIAHLPKVVLLGKRQNLLSCYVLLPNGPSLLIGSQLVLLISSKNGHIQPLVRQLIHCSQ